VIPVIALVTDCRVLVIARRGTRFRQRTGHGTERAKQRRAHGDERVAPGRQGGGWRRRIRDWRLIGRKKIPPPLVAGMRFAAVGRIVELVHPPYPPLHLDRRDIV
jgi:hypothetical protein